MKTHYICRRETMLKRNTVHISCATRPRMILTSIVCCTLVGCSATRDGKAHLLDAYNTITIGDSWEAITDIPNGHRRVTNGSLTEMVSRTPNNKVVEKVTILNDLDGTILGKAYLRFCQTNNVWIATSVIEKHVEYEVISPFKLARTRKESNFDDSRYWSSSRLSTWLRRSIDDREPLPASAKSVLDVVSLSMPRILVGENNRPTTGAVGDSLNAAFFEDLRVLVSPLKSDHRSNLEFAEFENRCSIIDKSIECPIVEWKRSFPAIGATKVQMSTDEADTVRVIVDDMTTVCWITYFLFGGWLTGGGLVD